MGRGAAATMRGERRSVITVDKALETVLAHAPTLPTEQVAIEDALGRVLAEDVRSDSDMPPFDRSAMDGFAVRAADVALAPAVLAVVGIVRAGQEPDRPLEPGQALQIMTGAPIPDGATAVQRVEQTRTLPGGRVEVSPVAPGENVVKRGSEVRSGDLVLDAGQTIDPATLGVLAAVGQGRPRVGRRPQVGVLATGDELVDVVDRPSGGRIRNSNGYAVSAAARWAGADVRNLGTVGDSADLIVEAMRPGLELDVLVVSGGVSVGAFDLVEGAMARLDVSILFDKVAIRPGAPLVFGVRGRTLVFGLPGNPVSAQVTFDLFVRAALLRMQGARVVTRPAVEVALLDEMRNASGRRAHFPALVRSEGGGLVAQPLPSVGSADLVAHARANALVALDAGRVRAAPGERATAVLLGNFLDRDGSS
jgi:molybdopterin molybdotransferase